MSFEAWHLAAMEEYGYITTNDGLINRLAHFLVKNYIGTISDEEFRNACCVCNVDPDSFTQEDFEKLQRKIYLLT